MANYANLKAAIDTVIKANGQQEITGTVLNQTLTAMVNSLGAGYLFMGVAIPSTNPGTPDQNVFYLAGQEGTYSNFGAITLQAGLSILKYNGTWSSETLFTFDASITQNSGNPITSGAVFEKMKLDGGAYDVSAHNNNQTFASLSALLSDANLSTLIPMNIRSGGMSIKFIQSSDNNYVEFFCIADEFTTDATKWQGTATKEDFTNPTTAKKIKIATVGSVIDGVDIYKKGLFLQNKIGVEELYIFDTSANINTLHLVYNGPTTWEIRFFDSNNSLCAKTDVYTSKPTGILPIKKNDTDTIIGYIIPYWNAFADGTSTIIGQLTDNCYNKQYSPRISNLMQDAILTEQATLIGNNTTAIGNEETRAITAENNLAANTNYNNGYYTDFSTEQDEVWLRNLNIASGKKIIIIIDNSNRTFTYANLNLRIDNVLTKIATITGKKVYTLEYTTTGVVTLMNIYYSNLSVGGAGFAKILVEGTVAYDTYLNGKNISELDGEIGDLTELETTEKSSIVGAINEVNTKITTNTSDLKNSLYKRSVFILNKRGIDELYIFNTDESTIKDLHFVNKHYNGYWQIIFFDANGVRCAQTPTRSSEPTGILPIYKYVSGAQTNIVLGYVIVQWAAFNEGQNTVLGDITDNCYDINYSPRIYNYLQNERMDIANTDNYLADGILNAPIVIQADDFDDTATIISKLNSAFEDFGRLCRCHWYDADGGITNSTCMTPLNIYEYTEDVMIETVNHNLRNNVLVKGMSKEMMAKRINYFLTVPAYRFCDAKLNSTNDVDFSLPLNFPVGEPSAIVSDDGSIMYVYCGCLTRYKTTDGVNFVKDADIKLNNVVMTDSNPDYLMHCNTNYINGTYYLIGTHNNGYPLTLWTSVDGINFTKIGDIMPIGEVINEQGHTVSYFGNTYLYKDPYGKWYLYFEVARSAGGVNWETCVAWCDDILSPVWTMAPNNPVFKSWHDEQRGMYRGYGNPCFAVGENNLPVKHDGKYYIYLHGENAPTAGVGTTIRRLYSYDLVNWTSEGEILDVRDVPHTISNADACFQQFKGRTYQFYTYDINPTPEQQAQGYDSQLRLLIDDRPFEELLKLRP